ncbi:GAF domain-containing protein [Nostoc sp. UCD120]|uniref:GAF domain-containing protein n=1 Tax=Nostoc sp. UCD120 TaxID=2681312 RepID=UPI001627A015|nr:GAF domain-containing protein [Nostoc sp. UCD120]MBC1225410.1 GAF domain-containing protein [Nostoc sp. UCD120]
MGFDFANISLISKEQNTIESVHGIGIGKQWSSFPRHYLEKDPELRDIQADIIATGRTEIISGWDKRFDSWIYKEYAHENIIRVFTPILVVEDDDGRLIEDWFGHCCLETVDFQPEANGERQGQHKIYQMRLAEDWEFEGRKPEFIVIGTLPEGRKPEFIVIGTLEAGYCFSDRLIEQEELKELLKCIAKWSLRIWGVQLPRVLETIAEIARKNLNADAATLHFLYEKDPQPGSYIYNVFSGGVGKQFLKACPPRNDGLGRRAIEEKNYKFISNQPNDHENSTIAESNPKAFEAGIRAMVAFPLLVDGKEGVLYVLFQDQHEFVEPLLNSVNKLVQRCAVDAISDSARIQQMRDKIRWQTLHSITQSLSNIPDSNVLRRIAWNTLNMLGVDVVNIYEYVQIENRFITSPNTAGRLKQGQMIRDEIIGEHNVPFLLINGGKNVYASCLKDTIFENSSFSSREIIKSTAGILLKVDNHNIVGVMFINYRRPHNFDEDEKKIIETLADSAAITIQNHKWLTSRETINRKIITTTDQEKLLLFITKEALKITGADVVGIYLFDSSKQELLTKCVYDPNNIRIDPSESRLSINQGIIGWVTENRKSALVKNVQSDERYFSGFDNIRSELCVPLLDKEDRILGVLNVESQRIAVFNERHQKILEDLANQAVIGIQGWKSQEQLSSMKTTSAVGNIASQLVHRINNDVGAIRMRAKKILDQGDEFSKNEAERIFFKAEEIMTATNVIQSLAHKKPQSVNLLPILDSILEKKREDYPNITVQPSLPVELPLVFGIEEQFVYIFDNLIQNAVEAMSQKGSLFITVELVQRDVGNWVQVKIRDTGIGIPAENLEIIFEWGFTTKQATGGMGFGLWWTKYNVLELLYGHLDVESRPEEGAQFTLLLPLYQMPEANL